MNQSTQRSTFVTVLAWIYICLSGMSVLISLVQNIAVSVLFDQARLDQAAMQAAAPNLPPFVPFLLQHFQLFFLAFLLVSIATLAISIGLLKRMNWARLCFVGLMAMTIVWNLGGLVLQFFMLSSMRQMMAEAAAQGGPDMQPILILFAAVGIVFALGFSALWAWIAKRLLSPAIAAEFRA